MNRPDSTVRLNPFPGLRPFREDEEHLFFGRESQVDTMVDKLARTRFLAVVGTSGSGKSSLVNSGLRPALHRGLMARAGTTWRMVQFRPGANPLRAAARALAREGALFGGSRPEGLSLVEIVEATLRMSKLGLADVCEQAQLSKSVNLLVVVDQFEELFRYSNTEVVSPRGEQDRSQEATAFVNLLLEAHAQVNTAIYIVLTMRSDFLGDCPHFPGLAEAINAGQYLVPRLTREERRAAISGPVGVAGGQISTVLLTRLVNDVGDNPDQLSILQHALNRTWAAWQRDSSDGPMSLSHYEAIGTMEHALDQHAERAYAELTQERQHRICEKIFKALTDRGTDARGIRRPTSLAALCALAEASTEEVTEVIDVFRKPSRSFLMPPLPEVLELDTVIDISHESLMRVWERLRTWSDAEAQAAQLYRRISQTALLHGNGQAALWRDPDLRVALDWWDRDKPNKAWAGLYGGDFDSAATFLQESRNAQIAEIAEKEHQREKELRRVRRSALGLATGLLIVSVLSAVALRQWQKAEHATKSAIAETQKAQRGQSVFLADLARQQREHNNFTVGLLLALQALPRSMERPDRPYMAEAEQELYLAAINQRESVVFIPKWQRTSYDARGAVIDLSAGTAAITDMAISPNGKSFAVAYAGGAESGASVLDIESGSLVAKLIGHQVGVTSVTFSFDGRRVATASWDNTARIWDAATGKQLAVLAGHAKAVTQVVFSHDGRRLVTAAWDNTARLWDAATGRQLGVWAGRPQQQEQSQTEYDITSPLMLVALSPDGKRLATASAYDTDIRVFDTEAPASQSPLVELTGHKNGIARMAFSPDGRLLATATSNSRFGTNFSNGSARLYDTQTWTLRAELAGDQEKIVDVAFSHDGSRLATASTNDSARVWDSRTATPIREFSTGSGGVTRVAFSPDGSCLATASADTAQLWDIETGVGLGKFVGHSGKIIRLLFSSDGRHLATAASDDARIWRAETGKRLLELKDHNRAITRVAFSPDGHRLATGYRDGTARLWDIDRGQPITELTGHGSREITSVTFSPDGSRLVTAAEDDITVRVWNARNGTLQAALTGPGRSGDDLVRPITHVCFSPDGRLLATAASQADSGRLWDLVKASPIGELTRHKSPFTDLACSPDGRLLAIAYADRSVRVLDLKTREQLSELISPEDEVVSNFFLVIPATRVTFSPDGSRIATASTNSQTARIWDVATAKSIAKLTGHGGPVTDVVFSPSGSYLATVSGSGYLWDSASGKSLGSWYSPAITHVAFSRDGNRVATDSAVFDIVNRQISTRFVDSTFGAFSPDGSHLAATTNDGAIWLQPFFPNTQALIDYANSRRPHMNMGKTVEPRDLTADERKQFFLEQ